MAQKPILIITGRNKSKVDELVKTLKRTNEEVKEDSDPCWDSHKMVGMKSKGGKQVPNCVPKEETQDGAKKLVAKIMKEKFGATKDLGGN